LVLFLKALLRRLINRPLHQLLVGLEAWLDVFKEHRQQWQANDESFAAMLAP
jgi:hypothetical protein